MLAKTIRKIALCLQSCGYDRLEVRPLGSTACAAVAMGTKRMRPEACDVIARRSSRSAGNQVHVNALNLFWHITADCLVHNALPLICGVSNAFRGNLAKGPAQKNTRGVSEFNPG